MDFLEQRTPLFEHDFEEFRSIHELNDAGKKKLYV